VRALKVGELAKRTGLTVRTLHHYDEIELVRPSLRTESGHRLYTAADVTRLQQVLSLRQLGFALEEIRACLARADFSPVEVIRLHVERLREQIELQRGLCARLEALADHFRPAGEVSVEQFLQTIESMTMIENYYPPDQLEALRKRREEAAAAGVDVARQGQEAWATLFTDLKELMDAGVDPADPRAQAIEQRRRELVNAFTGGDKGIEESLTRLWKEQGDKMATQYGYDPKLMEYLGKVVAAGQK
jgi:DNA-binding transcriptional MerR regulator